MELPNYETNDLPGQQISILERMLERYIKYWPLLVALIAVNLGIAFVYLKYTVPSYEVSALIMLKEADSNLSDLTGAAKTGDSKDPKTIENEIVVLASKPLADEVVKNLRLYAPIYTKGQFFNRSAYLVSPVIIEALNPDSLKGQVSGSFKVTAGSSTITSEGKTYALNSTIIYHGIKIRFLLNPNNHGPIDSGTFFFTLLDLKTASTSLDAALEIELAKKETTLIGLKIKDEVPKRGEDILNALIASYNKKSIKEKTKAAANTLKFVQNRLSLMEGQLDTIQNGIETFRATEGAVDISQQSSQYLSTVNSNEQRLSELKPQFAVLDQIEAYIKSSDGDSMVPSTFGIDDPLLPQMLAKLSDLRTQYERLRKTTAENNPILSSVRNEIDLTKPNILEIIKNHRNTLLTTRSNIQANTSKYNSMLNTIPTKEKRLSGISRQQLTKNSIYNFLLQKREETELSLISATADSRIISNAEATPYPVAPKKANVYMLSIALAFVLMIFFIGLKEIMNDKIINKNDIQFLDKMPFMSALSCNTGTEFLVMNNSKKSFLSHQFRQLRATIMNDLDNLKGKKILITSAATADGKLFVSSNLAISLAQAGKKVVLIELDFYKPRLAKQLGVKTIGLSDYILGKKTVDQVLQQSAINSNLYLIPAGSATEQAPELIINSNFSSLLTELENHFDIILMVTTPLIYSPDAYLMSKYVDRTLFIVREAYSKKEDLETIKAESGISHLKNAALIYNGVRGNNASKVWEVYG